MAETFANKKKANPIDPRPLDGNEGFDKRGVERQSHVCNILRCNLVTSFLWGIATF